eukprot:1184402-Prorocentrum_minimum.AAC.2
MASNCVLSRSFTDLEKNLRNSCLQICVTQSTQMPCLSVRMLNSRVVIQTRGYCEDDGGFGSRHVRKFPFNSVGTGDATRMCSKMFQTHAGCVPSSN